MKKFITIILVVCLTVVPLNYSALTDTNAAYNTAESISQGVENGAEHSTTSVDLTQGTTTGYLGNVTHSNIDGWTWNDAYPNTPIDTHIYIKQGETIYDIKGATANVYRSDLWVAGYGDGYHGFDVPMDWYNYWPGDYQVWAFGINNTTNPNLINSPKTFTVEASTGYVEGVTPTSIYGWAWKPSCPNRPVAIHVYIRDMEGNTVTILGADADDYRSDLWVAGYGNGFHGFTIPFDWSQMPRQRYIVEVHPVDHSGFNPIIYNEVYDNRKDIYLLGQTDANGKDRSCWMNSTVTNNCYTIGTPNVVKWTNFNKNDIINAIYNSHLFVIHTHGNRYGIQAGSSGSFESLTTYDLDGYSSDYFSSTKCVALVACSTAAVDGVGNNFMKTLEAKGVQSVVGFKTETEHYVYLDDNGNPTNRVVPDKGNCLWGSEFVKNLSEGDTVREATIAAVNEAISRNEDGDTNGLNSYDFAGNPDQTVIH